MKTAFLDTSFINYCIDNNISISNLHNILEKNNLLPVIGIYTTYELAACSLKNKEKTVKLFRFVRNLNPKFSKGRECLYRMELNKLKEDQPFNPFITDELLLQELNKRVENYSEGLEDKKLKDFITERENLLEKSRTLWQPTSPLKYKKVKNFDECVQSFLKDFAHNTEKLSTLRLIFFNVTQIKYSDLILIKFVIHISTYPTLRALLLYHLYLDFLTEKSLQPQNLLKKDKFTDGVQIIEASYCSALITNDKDLANLHTKNLNPNITPIYFPNLINDSIKPSHASIEELI
ncbi:MAG: hypothetical protein K2Q14_05690 [Gammaproteobacteria bacterium]|nr:hypothetical protein [Gammaproteobacteria bacterium]